MRICASGETTMVSAAITHQAAPAAAGMQTFSGDSDRKRLTGAAIKAVLRLADAWGGSNAAGAACLGVSVSTWDRIQAGQWEGHITEVTLALSPAQIGIFKDLTPARSS